MSKTFYRIGLAATVLALCVVVLGAYVRLSDAGLGCPDWPGCYGNIGVPTEATDVVTANQAYPERPVEIGKAWKEMIHRYLAGVLGLIVLCMAVVAWRNRIEPHQSVGLPIFLVALIIFQAALGMWTVTLQLKPVIVMAHLLGGLTMVSLLGWVTLRHHPVSRSLAVYTDPRPRFFVAFGFVLLVIQIALGGWTSANYAALACPDFPTCQSALWPPMDVKEAFVLWRGTGVSYEFGVLDNDARVAIHFIHRLGALVVFCYLAWLSVKTLVSGESRALKVAGAIMGLLLLLQVSLGIGNVVLGLPLWVAASHNGVAALLLLSMVTISHLMRPR